MKEVDSHINELIVKSLIGDIQQHEEKALPDWANSSESNARYLSEMQKIWAAGEGLKAFNNIDVEHDFNVFKSRVGMKTHKSILYHLTNTWNKVAAVMIPALLLITAYALYLTTPGFGKWVAFKTHGKINEVILADNSQVELNVNSKLVYEKSFNKNKRLLRLDGEGYFKVAKDPLKPFVVKVGNAEVRVLGTEFNIDEDELSGNVTLAVTEGKVLFSSDKSSINVSAGEMASLIDGDIVKQPLKSDNCISWKTGVVDFNEASLEEVIEVILDHFEEIKSVNNKSNKTTRLITTRFESPSLEDVLMELRIHFEKKFEIYDNKLVISD